MNRDNLGRFTTAQHADALAAERLLERAVAEAVRLIGRGKYRRDTRTFVEADHRLMAEMAMEHAGHAAELLMGGAA